MNFSIAQVNLMSVHTNQNFYMLIYENSLLS